jgi:VIT1/CCC1 family predicted Fe2+/Mn2+ transporter
MGFSCVPAGGGLCGHGPTLGTLWLRAGVLGANDGIVSTAAVVVGVASATSDVLPVLLAGSAALFSIRARSVSRWLETDTYSPSAIEIAPPTSAADPASSTGSTELTELVGLYEQQGLSHATATAVATELTERDALKAHLAIELGIDQDDVVVAGDGERQQHRHECGHDPGRMRQQEDRRHRQQRTGEERDGGCHCRVPRAHDRGVDRRLAARPRGHPHGDRRRDRARCDVPRGLDLRDGRRLISPSLMHLLCER